VIYACEERSSFTERERVKNRKCACVCVCDAICIMPLYCVVLTCAVLRGSVCTPIFVLYAHCVESC